MKTKPFILFGLAVVLLFAAASYAVSIRVKTSDNSGIYTTKLIAGQHTDIGEVIVQADNTFLYVQYQIDLDNEYTLFNTHLWAGQDLAEMPVNRKGNPTLGKFPYTATQLDSKSWVQEISLYSLGLTVEDICLEDAAVFFAAHATVTRRIDDLSSESETAWAEGEPINTGGAWGMYDEVCLTCEVPSECDTAWAFGQTELDDILPTDRWGWVIGPYKNQPADVLIRPLYAGAEQNDIAEGTVVGNVLISYYKNYMVCNVAMLKEYELKEVHLHADYDLPLTDEPDQFQQNNLLVNPPSGTNGTNATFYGTEYNGDPIFIALHAIVCERDE